MAYADIENLYKNADILLFKECYALEKIHGTSAHIKWSNGNLTYFSGGVKHEDFVKLFIDDVLRQGFETIGQNEVTVYGEAYGGKCQGMSKTYGTGLQFVVFEVRIGDSWLVVPSAEEIAKRLSLEFMPYARIPATLDAIDAERDADSVIAIRRGMCGGHMREGVVLHPLIELRKSNGERIIAKHKRDEFRETKTPRAVDPEKLAVLADAQAIANEWVTDMRLAHVMDSLGGNVDVSRTGDVIKAMIADVEKESIGETEITKDARKAIGGKAAKMFKAWLKKEPKEN